MVNSNTSCIKCVDGINTCIYCCGKLLKNGISRAKKQRYKCKDCNKTIVENYTYNAYFSYINKQIVILLTEGLGIRSIARILKISVSTLLKRIIAISDRVNLPVMTPESSYEIDELCTFVKCKSKRIWIVYAFERETKNIVGFNVGPRTNLTLKKVVDKVLKANPQVLFTDRLKNYKSLIHQCIHKTVRFGTNNIERANLTLRTHLKRLNRKTICFSKSEIMFKAVLKIYFGSVA
ncbi:IS1 family transposase [Paenimyroides baculatum]|uniref:IS1 family transposase n=1 Tax=Paenimyroides baculatum TaxID=2608000 RepID=A0A5M6CKM4_9FLAO|nr:IS1 family transposase [Paenimyroides baculatum]KAA5535566.1 IS1 family transposase [Paenimyroides baculatum]